MFEDKKDNEYLIIMENPLLKLNDYKVRDSIQFEELNSNDGESFCILSTDPDKPSLILESTSNLYLVKNDNVFTKIDRENPLILPLEVKEESYLINVDKLPAYFIWEIVYTICFIMGIGKVQKINDSNIISLNKNEFKDFGRFGGLFTAKLSLNKKFDSYKDSKKEYINLEGLIIKPYGTYLDGEDLESLDYEIENTPKGIRGVMLDTFNL